MMSGVGFRTDTGYAYHDALNRYRCALIRAALIRHGGNVQRAARALGLQRTYVFRLIATFGIDRPRRGRRAVG